MSATAAAVWIAAASQSQAAAVVVVAGSAACLLLLWKWSVDEGRQASEDRESHRELVESLQVTRSEAEAQQLVKRHLERITPGATVTLLTSGSRLQAADAESQSCLAIRLGQTHEQSAAQRPLLACELCAETNQSSVCVPSFVAGDVVGAILIQQRHGGEIAPRQRDRILDSVAHAAPVLSHLRNLELAEARAATDALTGLPNSRALRETLKRMIAQAGRTFLPFSVVMIDLDHFKLLNETYGRERGDEALTSVGLVLGSAIRASDYAGRYGGEQFLILLPNTDREGAIRVAEKLRNAIGRINLPGIPEPLSASLGVAALPADGGDADALVRLADRALYAAKAGGRNRVEAAGLSVATPVRG